MVYLRSRLAIFIRQKRGSQSQREFARRSGVAQSTIMRVENMEQNVTLDTLEQLCRVFRVDVGELFPALPEPRAYAGRAPRPGLVHERTPGGANPAGERKARRRPRGKTSGNGGSSSR